jgi:hypothetical protein
VESGGNCRVDFFFPFVVAGRQINSSDTKEKKAQGGIARNRTTRRQVKELSTRAEMSVRRGAVSLLHHAHERNAFRSNLPASMRRSIVQSKISNVTAREPNSAMNNNKIRETVK